MFKLAVVITLIGFVCANPTPQANGAGQAAAGVGFGNWPFQFPNLNFQFPNPESIANMKPGPGGTVLGSYLSNNMRIGPDGKPITEGHYVVNRNGVVESGSIPNNNSQ